MNTKNYWNDEKPLRELAEALAAADEPRFVEEFLESLFTEAEISEMGKRWALVRLLDEGVSQRNIAKELGLSLCKITRGSKELKKEDSPFQRMIDLYKKEHSAPTAS
jgi:TrpR family trp operon transcriptional repressor